MKLSLNIYLMCLLAVCLSLNSISIQAQMVGQKAPTLILPDINGADSDLADLKGNYVYLHFWASWCPNSLAQLPTLTQIHNEYKDQDFKIYSVSLDGNRDAWLNAIQNYQLTWPQHQCDFSGPFSQRLSQYNFIGTPFGYLISPDGTILEVDPDLNSYQKWFKMEASSGDYYTINLGSFSNLEHVDFDYIEELDKVETGLNNDNSYYVHLGKYTSRAGAEQVLMQALTRGYYEATIITDTYDGDMGLNYVPHSVRSIEESQPTYYTNTIPEQNTNTTPNTFSSNSGTYNAPYSPLPPQNNATPNTLYNNPNTYTPYNPLPPVNRTNPAPQQTNPSTAPVYQEPFFQKGQEQQPKLQSKPFFTPPTGDIVKKESQDEAYSLPGYAEYPETTKKEKATQSVTYEDSPKEKTFKDEKDLFSGQNPYIEFSHENGNKTFDFQNKWNKTDGGLEPLPAPETPVDLTTPDNDTSTEGDFSNYSFDDYANNHPLDNLYIPESKAITVHKEGKYERKLRIKKQKAKRKQEKLKREMEATKKMIEEIDESIMISRKYPEN
ncbi:MAG: redoxin domain-containing protein [Chitinophagales bacterium]